MRIEKDPVVKQFASLIQPEEGVLEIAQGAYGISTHTLAAYAASCVIAVGHNTATTLGMVGHFSAISHSSRSNPLLTNEQFGADEFNASIDALRELGPPQSTHIWIGGAALSLQSEPMIIASIVEDRRYAEHQLRNAMETAKIPSSNLLIDWNHTQNDIYVTLHCPTSLLRILQVAEEEL